ncbi:protein translocase subunit SecD [Amphiplicatus metriothermophilus]|uniref:Protein translocase subunit SecD n=1 Tax=Amphiplicatus metriothermophilus TaxID=1519374 RepID=A0A239PQB8_9PROT|nr:protein translocase subunit SecD [Amphiplicatus metriothermophilus]MBB5518340.1 protein-export membrane protein SecD [Amphiplicatus metriothermophilus]SNT72489.1 preprotein translocase subunit SecD [Amphiplicatus metriothermophilus]
MLQFSKWQVALVAAVVALGAIFAAPNLIPKEQLDRLPGFLPKGTINLGLDLRGGSYLLLGVDTDKVIADRLSGMRQEIQRAMRPSGGRERVALVSLPSVDLEMGTISLRVREPDQADEAARRVRDVTRTGVAFLTAPPYTVSVQGDLIEVRLTPEARRQYAAEALQDSIEVVRRRVDPAGNKEVSIQPQGADRIVIQAPGDNDPEELKRIVNRTGQLSFHRVDPTVSLADAEAGLLPPGRILVPFAASEGPGALVLYEEPEVTGDMVETASAGLNTDGAGFQINFSFDSRGARRFADYTREHVGELFAIVLDNEIISAPRIQTPIPGGQGRITGNFSPDEAARIATLIRSGALPAPLTTLEQRTVGPDLGADSVRAGTTALVIGFLAVIIYMVATYGRFGVYADMALLANVVLIAGALSLFGSTLTLPGIAGIVLTVGMAVDANVLIFERIREELVAGKGPVNAVETGYRKAWSAILDANVTTFLAALIMFQLGAGPVRGFAVTLATGVVTSVFTAFVLTRMFAGGYLLARRPATITI